MPEKTERSEDASDSFESWLRQAVRAPLVGARSLLTVGSKVASGRLEILRRIGEGGMGVVYEAFDTERRAKVALKTLSRLDAAGIYRLKNEFRALADVAHPNLVALHELFADEAQWLFTMDLVPGVRFDEWVRPSGTLNEARLRSALEQLVSAVLAIHDAGKLHRDLKPSNVLVTDEGRVVVLDFGLAVDPEPGGVGQTIAEESVSGTPAYMAPEQAAGRQAIAASDFYAIGVMLFEALTGKLPFDGRIGEMLAAKQRDAAPDVRKVFAEAPADLVALCAELLRRDPNARLNGTALRERFIAHAGESTRPSTVLQLAELVGRDAELAALRDAYSAACSGEKPVIVLLCGESGIGKSALLDRFLGELRTEGRAVVLAGRCYERESVPFKGFDVLIDELSRYLRKLSAIETTALIPREVSSLRRLFPVLGRIEAIANTPERIAADAFELRRRGFLALGELFGRIRDRQPLVLAIDDLQWSDRDSTALLLHLVRQADAPRVLLIASHRSERMHQNPVLTPLYETLEVDMRLDVRKLGIGPLPAEAAAALVSDLGATAQALVREAGGNPFLLRELARAGGALRGRSLAEVLRDRIAKLPQAERAVLELMAVAARPLPLELAAAAAEIPAARAAFDGLRASQLARSGVQPGTVECYHDRVREAVTAGLGADATRAHHAALAQALLQTADPDPEHLAEHFEHAGDAQRAGEYAVIAADRAVSGFAFDQAARLYEKALSLAAFEPAEAHRLRVALADALANAGRGVASAEAYLRATDGVPEAEIAKLKASAAAQYMLSGRLGRVLELVAQALSYHGITLSPTPARAMATVVLERTRLRLRGLELAPREPEPEARKRLASLWAIVSGLTGVDVLNGAALNLRLLRLALDAGAADVAFGGLLTEIVSRGIGVGGLSPVPALARRAQALLEVARVSPSPKSQRGLGEAVYNFVLGIYEYLYRPDGDLEEALRCFDRHLAFAQANPQANPQLVSAQNRAQSQGHRIAVLGRLGRFAEAARELPALVDNAWERNDLFMLPNFIRIAVTIFLATGAEAEAERVLTRCEQAWSALENPYSSSNDTWLFIARCYLLRYRRETRAAWDVCQAHHVRFVAPSTSNNKAALFARSAYWERGMTAAALAGETASASERKALIQVAERIPSVLRTRTATLTRDLPLLRVAAACARRDRDRAVRLLREASAGPTTSGFPPVRAHALRRRLGELLGGDEGKALVGEADAFFREGGVVDPERLVAMLLPGCEIR